MRQWNKVLFLLVPPSLTAIPQPYFDTGQGQFVNTTLSTVPPEATEQPATSSVPDDVPALISSPGELRDTLVFAAMCQYCCDSADFWYGLSGCGMITKDRELVSAWNLECVGKKRRIHEQYLRHLASEKDDKDVPSCGIVSVVETLVDMGYLQSIKETKDYMIEIGKPLFRGDHQAYGQFILWITSTTASFVCPTCRREFPRKWNMERHIKDVHNKRSQKGQKEESRKRRKKEETCALETPVSMFIKDE